MDIKKIISIIMIVCISFMVITYNPTPARSEVITLSLAAFTSIAYIAGAAAITAGSAYFLYEDFKSVADSGIVSQLNNLVVDSVTGMAAIGDDLYTAIYNYIQGFGHGTYSDTIPNYANAVGLLSYGINELWKPAETTRYFISVDGETPWIELGPNSLKPAERTTITIANTSVSSATHYDIYGTPKLEISRPSTNKITFTVHYADASGTWKTISRTSTGIIEKYVTAGILHYAPVATISSGVSTADSGYWNQRTYDTDHDNEDLRGKKAIPPLPIDWFGDLSTGFPDSYSSPNTWDTTTSASDVWTGTTSGSETWPFDIPILGDILTGLQIIANAISNVFAIPDTLNIEWSYLHVGLTDRFPFSIPFDLVAAFTGWQAVPSAPQWTIAWKGVSHTIDFSVFNPLATIIRWGILIIFNFGLIVSTRKLIRG